MVSKTSKLSPALDYNSEEENFISKYQTDNIKPLLEAVEISIYYKTQYKQPRRTWIIHHNI